MALVQNCTNWLAEFLKLAFMRKNDEPNMGYFAGIGLQMCVGAALGYAVGSWLDQRYGWKSGAVTGFIIGLSAGLYLLIKDAIRINKD